MNPTPAIIACFAAAILCCILAVAVVLRKRSIATGSFSAGMLVFAVESFYGACSLAADSAASLAKMHTGVLLAKSLLPFFWIIFSISYLRGDATRQMRRWRPFLLFPILIPLIAFSCRDLLVDVKSLGGGGWWLDYKPLADYLTMTVLLCSIIILMNLEKTLRSAIGSARWKIKFAMLGLAVIFGARIYTRSQTMLFSGFDLNLTIVEVSSLLLGCSLIFMSLLRHGFEGVDIYPSLNIIRGSITLILAGVYLLVIGVLAQVIACWSWASDVRVHSILVLLGLVVLAVVLLSDRFRQSIRAFAARNFQRPQHDARSLWSAFTEQLGRSGSPFSFCDESSKLIARTFDVLSVTVWTLDGTRSHLIAAASTCGAGDPGRLRLKLSDCAGLLGRLGMSAKPLEIDEGDTIWPLELLERSKSTFKNGGKRLCLPLTIDQQCVGFITMVDRVNGISYSVEELDLLRCISDQIAATLLHFQLSEEMMQGRELAAFQLVSTFFVHDLKNAASSLTLMLENLPNHFHDPEFRKDALRGIGSTVGRINDIIGRLGGLRNNLPMQTGRVEPIRLVKKVLGETAWSEDVNIQTDLKPVPDLDGDAEQLESVVTNLFSNARDSLPLNGGQIRVSTDQIDGKVAIAIADNGCGMTTEFINDSLFKPFLTTKRKGLGIGLFQSRMIVNAHRGSLQVESVLGEGTTFRILLPSARAT